jgi:hypothetical protein
LKSHITWDYQLVYSWLREPLWKYTTSSEICFMFVPINKFFQKFNSFSLPFDVRNKQSLKIWNNGMPARWQADKSSSFWLLKIALKLYITFFWLNSLVPFNRDGRGRRFKPWPAQALQSPCPTRPPAPPYT